MQLFLSLMQAQELFVMKIPVLISTLAAKIIIAKACA